MVWRKPLASKTNATERETVARRNLNALGRALNARIQEQHLTPEEVEKQIEQTKRKVYQARYG
jgi:hypothetical protein